MDGVRGKNRKQTHQTSTQAHYTAHKKMIQNAENEVGKINESGVVGDHQGGHVCVRIGVGEHYGGWGRRKEAKKRTEARYRSWVANP